MSKDSFRTSGAGTSQRDVPTRIVRFLASRARSRDAPRMRLRCIITAGPTCEPLDGVRRLTNFSTGKLGTQLAAYLVAQGHDVTLLRGEAATHSARVEGAKTETFLSTADLEAALKRLAITGADAVFHAAAVSDFKFGRVFDGSPDEGLTEIHSGKFSTRTGRLFAELVPTPKILPQLRSLFPNACLVGWKYEVDGDRESVLAKARQQLTDCHTDACVANGPAYGEGFGVVRPDGSVRPTQVEKLAEALTSLALDLAVRR